MKRRQSRNSSEGGNGLKGRAGAKKDEEPEIVETLTCPIMKKIAQAFVYAKTAVPAVFAEGDESLGPGSRCIRGLHDAEVHLQWQEQDSVLIVAFKSPEPDIALDMLSSVYDQRRRPHFLSNAAPGAEVHGGFLDILDSFQKGQDGQETLADTVKELTGDRTPRRIIMTGFCVGGSLATIAACWAALQSPTSDVRCITFGAPRVGNAAFVEAFRWLVGVSYRVSFGSDPIASAGGGVFGSFASVPGAIHLDEAGDMETEEAWLKNTFWADMKDHCVARYKWGLCTQITKLKMKYAQLDGSAEAPAQATEQAFAASVAGEGPLVTQEKDVFGSAESHAHGLSQAAASMTGAISSVPAAVAGAGALAAGMRGSGEPKAPAAVETEDEREARHESAAAGLFRSVVAEATGGQDIGVAKTPYWLTRAFSLVERDDLTVNLDQLTTLQKVLVIGKISNAVVLAGAAYQDASGYARMTGLPREQTRLLDDKGRTDTQVHVSWMESGTAVFSFRGTESTQDGLQDLKLIRRNIDFLARACPGAKAHTGFLQQFAAVNDDDRPHLHLAHTLKQLSGGRMPNRVICTGHSLGGALATLCAAWAAIEYPDADVRCVSFGSPRVGNRKFKKAFHGLVGTSLRLAYGGDPVPNFPSYRYDHVGCSLHVKKCGIELHARPWHWGWRPVLGDHFLGKYTAGVYSHIPGAMAALPKFDEDSDFAIPANMVKDSRRIGCLGMTDTVEAESSSRSESNSPRHPDSAAELQNRSRKRAKSGSGKREHKRATHVPSASADEQGQAEAQPLAKAAGQGRRGSSMPILSRIRSRFSRKDSSEKDTSKIAAAAQQAIAAY